MNIQPDQKFKMYPYLLRFLQLLSIIPCTIFAQDANYLFQHFNTKDGLATEKANCIFQDSKGIYWIGTDIGLQKFDGKFFSPIMPSKNYQTTDSLLPGIFDPMLEDKEGNIWGRSFGFISVYYPLTGNKEKIIINDETIDSPESDVEYFCKDSIGDIWIITKRNIYKYDYVLRKPILWLNLFPELNKYYWKKILYEHSKNILWIAGGENILSVDIKSKSIRSPFQEYSLDSQKLTTEYPVSFWLDNRENIWFSDWLGGIYKYNTISFRKDKYQAQLIKGQSNTAYKSIATCFAQDEKGVIWLGTGEGYFYYDNVKDSIMAFPVNNARTECPRNENIVGDLKCDREGNILACVSDGLTVFPKTVHKFTIVDNNNITNQFPNIEVTSIFETTNKDILIGTWGKGWYWYDTNFNLKRQFYFKDPPSLWWVFKKNMVWDFAEDLLGNIWIGYQNGLIGILDTTILRVTYIEVPEFGGSTVRVLNCDSQGNIWFGLDSGLLGKWDVVKNKFLAFDNSIQLSELKELEITDILITHSNQIWVSIKGNYLYHFDPIQEKITESYKLTKMDSPWVLTNSMSKINDSIFSLSTSYLGALFFNMNQKTFSPINVQNGLPNNQISGITTDDENNLWVSTYGALLRKNSTSNKLVLFDEDDGLYGKHFNTNLITLDGQRIAIGTTNGFVYFPMHDENTIPIPPDVLITNFTVFNNSLLIDSLLKVSPIKLKHTQNFITINYASLSLMGRNTNRYFYQMEGVNKDWIEAGTERFASYTNMGPGHYTFKVKAENRDGIASKNITELAIYIRHPWWRTFWSYSLYTFLLGIMLYALYRFRINQLQKTQSAQINTMVATQESERKRIARDLHDDVGTKLSALKLFLSSLSEKAADTNNEEIKSLALSSEKFISEAMTDVRQLLLNLSPTVLEEFGYTVAVQGLINKVNETKSIHFSLVVFGMQDRLQKDYELALYRITQELINNILKHAQAKNVSLQIGQRDEKIILMIEDDGLGFNVNSHKEGYGLNNLNARTKLMHGTMVIDSHPGKGTSVLIEIPYHLN